MKPYILRNDDVQHAERLALVKHFSKLRGRKVTYKEVLHELQSEKIRALNLKA